MNVQQRAPGETFAGYTTLKTKVCPACGIMYAAPARLFEAYRDQGGNWYCPNGHSIVFVGKTTEEKLADARRAHHATRELLAHEQRSHIATRGHLTRARREKARLVARVANGVCPCCGRTFKQLAQHMQAKHPDWLDSHEGGE